MLIRKWILWCFFGLLGLNVIAGCYGLAIMEDNIFAPAIISSIVLALACLLVYPASWLSLLKHGKDASWVAMGLVILECLMSVALCWLVFTRSLGFTYRHEEFVGISMALLFPCGLVLMLGMYLLNFAHLKLAARTLIASVVLFLGLFVSGLYFHEILRDRNFGNNLIEGSAVWACTGIGLTVLLAGRWRWYKAVGLLATAGVVTVILMEITRMRYITQSNVWQVAAAASLAIVLAYYNLIYLLPLKNTWTKLTRLGALGLVLAGDAVLLVLCIWDRQFNNRQEEAMLMLVGMLAFIAICMTFVISFKAAADMIKIRRNDLPTHFNYTQLQIQCPHCQTMQLLTQAGQSCLQCGLKFHFRISEPHCEQCEYLLIGQASGDCPECGHPIKQVSGQAIVSV